MVLDLGSVHKTFVDNQHLDKVWHIFPFSDFLLLHVCGQSLCGKPMPVHPSPQRNLRILTAHDLNASVNATLAPSNAAGHPTAPVHRIKEDDYIVPDAPPPSPVMFRSDLWPASIRH